jgi:hypothetical protein
VCRGEDIQLLIMRLPLIHLLQALLSGLERWINGERLLELVARVSGAVHVEVRFAEVVVGLRAIRAEAERFAEVEELIGVIRGVGCSFTRLFPFFAVVSSLRATASLFVSVVTASAFVDAALARSFSSIPLPTGAEAFTFFGSTGSGAGFAS